MMYNKPVVIAAALSLAGNAVASPHNILERALANANCARDNLLRCFLDARYDAQVTAYCNNLPTFTTTVATVTATSYQTEYSTVTASTQTDIARYTTTSFTNTVPASTQTVVRPVPQFKRDVEPVGPPPCATNYPASRISSACSCVNVAAPTETVTYTVSEVLTTTLPSLVTATVTESTTETILAEATQGVKVVEVDYPVQVYNGNFDQTPARGWTWQVSSSAQLNGFASWLGAARTQAWILAFRNPAGVTASLTNSLPLKMVPGQTYKISFGTSINTGLGSGIALELKAPSSGTYVRLPAVGGTAYADRANWFKYEQYYTYPANWPVQDSILTMSIGPITYGGGYTIYLDDVKVEAV